MINHNDKKTEDKISSYALKIENLMIYYGHTKALSDVFLNVEYKEYLGIIGPNGGGKTTLLKAILGLVPISNGNIEIYGEKRKNASAMIGYVPQFSSVDKRFPITVKEVVMTGLMKKGLSPFFKFTNKDKEQVDEVLNDVGIFRLAGRRISSLSGGEFQKMLIARALAVKPKLLLLDEPTASVDINSRDQIYDLLARLNKNMTVVLVTHDLFAVSTHVQKLACLNGSLVYHGQPELSQDVVNNLYGCPVDLIAHGVPHRVLKMHEEGDGL